MILDGDIDPEWIEAMNTVMDDNKVLTLASNERIAMTGPIRMILEIEANSLKETILKTPTKQPRYTYKDSSGAVL